jgi:hypothetical protein
MTNSFDSGSWIVILNPMKDAIGLALSAMFIGFGSTTVGIGIWMFYVGVKGLVQILK